MDEITKLRYMRLDKGLTLREVGIKTGLHPTDIRMCENRYRNSYPKMRSLLCAFYEVTEEELFDLDGWAL